jgi:hypothetical protein
VARSTGSRCTGTRAIDHRSSCCGRRDPDEDRWLDLTLEEDNHRVSKVRGIKVKRLVQKRIEGRVEVHWSLAMMPVVLAALRALSRAAWWQKCRGRGLGFKRGSRSLYRRGGSD